MGRGEDRLLCDPAESSVAHVTMEREETELLISDDAKSGTHFLTSAGLFMRVPPDDRNLDD